MILKNKTGAEKYLSVYWFAILIIVAAAVSAMVINFYNSPYDVRELEANLMIDNVANCLSESGVLKIDSLASKSINSCETTQECQKMLGNKIVSIASMVKRELGIDNIDDSVKNDDVAENFECLVLQIAMQESSLQHCTNFKDENNNPLYCDGNINQVFKSSGDEIS